MGKIANLIHNEALSGLNDVFKPVSKLGWLENPATFRIFVESPEHMGFPPLSERQYAVADFMLGNDPEKIFDNKNSVGVLLYGKGCPAKGMRVFSADTSKLTPIEDWNGDMSLLSYKDNCIVSKKASSSFISGKGPIFRVKTRTGFSIDVFAGHKFLQGIRENCYNPETQQKDLYKLHTHWKELRDLHAGDHIAVIKKWDVTNGITPDIREAKLLGYWLGDGCLLRSSPSITIGWDKPEIKSDYLSIVTSFGLGYRLTPHYYGARCDNIYVSNRPRTNKKNIFRLIAEKYNIWGLSSYTKTIPDVVFSWNEESICTFLSTLYATDGWICYRSQYNKTWEKRNIDIGYCSMSRDLCFKLKLLLLRIGVRSTVKQKPGDKSYYVSIRSFDDARLFCSKVSVVNKQDKQRELLDFISQRTSMYFGSDKSQSDYAWDKIVSIEYLGDQDYYDLTVPDTENYICEGFISHNSGKDSVAVLVILYIVHVLLCMVSPQTFFGLPEGEALDILNVAANADQANTVFFDKLRQRVVRWKWLRDHYTVKISGIFLGQIKPEDFMNTIVVTKNGVLFPKNIRAFSGHSDESHQEGKNILCFVGDTLVSLVNGTNVPIKELVGKEPFYVYSYNGTKIVPGLAHSVHKTKEQADTVSVLLDNGQRVQCTPDHLFMLRDGSYKEAQYLVSGDSLMPLYRRYDRPELKDYELLYQPHVAHYQYTHRSFWASSTGSVRLQIPGHVIHHRNGNRRDNCPTNLALLTSQAHLDWHHSIHGKQHKIWWQNHPEHREKISKLFSNRIISTEHRAQLRALRLGKHLSEETKLRISVSTKGKHKSQQTRERMRAVIVTMKVDGRWQARGKKISQSLTGRVRSKEHCLKLSQGKRREIAALSPEQYYKRFATRCGASPSVETRQKISASLKHKWASKAVVNHKVISVTPAGQADVYDLTVDIYQNFALTAGVFVHNCFTLDESSAFDDSPTTNRAQKIFDMLKSSAVSRFGERFKGFVLSFPRYKDDFTMRLYKLAQGELHWFSDTGATWEIKPQHLFKDYPEKYFEFEGHKIPLEFESEFRHNPDDARGKYLCLPVEIEQAFIEYPDKIDLCVDAGRPPIAVVKDYVEEDKVKKSFNYFNNDLIYRDYVVTVDLGLRSDSAALSVFHKDFRIDGSYYVQDLAVTWVPNREKRLIVDLTNVEEFITTLSKQIHIIGVWFDQWNSALLSQRLTAAGLFSDIYRINFQDYKNMKDRLYEGHIRLLNFPTQISELKRLVLLRGGKVEHPVDGGKDAVDTIVGALKVLGEGGPGASSLVPSPLGGEIILGSNLTSEGGTFL